MTNEELQKLLDQSRGQLPMHKDIDVEGPVTDIDMNDLDPPVAQPNLPPISVEPVAQPETPPMEQNAAPASESSVQALLNKYNQHKVAFDPNNKPMGAAPEPQLYPESYKGDLSDDALKAALDEKRQQLMAAGLLRAGTTVGSAIAGTKANYEGIDALEKQAGLSAEGIQERRKGQDEELKRRGNILALKDTEDSLRGDSLESKMAVQIVNASHPKAKIPEGTPAATLYKLLPALKQATENAMPYISAGVDEQGHALIMDKRTGEIRSAGVTKADQLFQVKDPLTGEVRLVGRRAGEMKGGTVGAPKESTGKESDSADIFGTLNAKQRDSVQDNTKLFLKDTEKNRDALTGAQGVRNMLAAGKDGRIDYDSIRAIQNQFARASGEVGAMTERDVGSFGGRTNAIGRLERFLKAETLGQLPDEDRKFLSDLSKVMEDNASKAIAKQSAPYVENIRRDSGLKPEQAKSVLNVKASTGMQEGKKDPRVVKWAKEHNVSSYEKAAKFLMDKYPEKFK